MPRLRLLSFDTDSAPEQLAGGVLSEQDIALVREVASRQDCTVLRALDLGLVGEDRLASALADMCGVEMWSVGDDGTAGEVTVRRRAARVPAFERHAGSPVMQDGLRLAVSDPGSKHALRSVLSRLGSDLRDVVITTQKSIDRVFEARRSRITVRRVAATVDASSEVAQP